MPYFSDRIHIAQIMFLILETRNFETVTTQRMKNGFLKIRYKCALVFVA